MMKICSAPLQASFFTATKEFIDIVKLEEGAVSTRRYERTYQAEGSDQWKKDCFKT